MRKIWALIFFFCIAFSIPTLSALDEEVSGQPARSTPVKLVFFNADEKGVTILTSATIMDRGFVGGIFIPPITLSEAEPGASLAGTPVVFKVASGTLSQVAVKLKRTLDNYYIPALTINVERNRPFMHPIYVLVGTNYRPILLPEEHLRYVVHTNNTYSLASNEMV